MKYRPMVFHHRRIFSTEMVFILLGFLMVGGCRAAQPSAEFLAEIQQSCLTYLKMAAGCQPDSALKARAIRALQYDFSADSILWIRSGLFDPEASVRLATCLALIFRTDAQATLGVQRLLEDEDPLVQSAAMWYLTRLGYTEYRDRLLQQVLQSEALRCRPELIELMSSMTDILPADQLRNLLSSSQKLEPEFEWAIRAALIRMGDEATTRRVRMIAAGGSVTDQQRALEILSESIDPRTVYVLQERMRQAADPRIRLVAAGGLGRFDRRDGLKLIEEFLGSDWPKDVPQDSVVRTSLRLQAIQAAGDIGDASLLGALRIYLDREQVEAIQIAAAQAILKILANQRI